MTRWRDERGMATVALTMLVPVLFTFVWVAMGAAMYHFGATAAQAAAETAATAGAVDGGTTTACQQAGTRFISTLGDALSDVTITCRRTATAAVATVTGTTLSLVPGWAPTVTQTVTRTLEEVS